MALDVKTEPVDFEFISCDDPVRIKQEASEESDSPTETADKSEDQFKDLPEDKYKINHCKEEINYEDNIKEEKPEISENEESSADDTKDIKKMFKCQECTKTFTCRTDLIEHERIHLGDKPFECEYCKKRFRRLYILKNHMNVHTGEGPVHEDPDKRIFACNVCSKTFTRATGLKSHMRTHTGEKPFVCPYCNKSFKSKLIAHIRTHTGERPYQCDLCDKTFTTCSHLTVHKRKHTGDSN